MKEFRMPKDEELKAQAQQIQQFCSIVLPSETKIAITAQMPDETWQEYYESKATLPREWMEPSHDKLTDQLNGYKIVPKYQNLNSFLFSTKPSLKTMRKLWSFVRAGYNIYYSINPISCEIRSKATTRYMENFLIESDETDLETQRRVIEANKHMFVAYYYSGNRSIHAIAKLDTRITNSFCYGYQGAKLAKSKGTLVGDNNLEYTQAGAYIRNILEQHGLILCQSSCSSNYAQISRLPTFPNVKTGNIVNLEYTNQTNRIFLSEVKANLDNIVIPSSLSTEEQAKEEQAIPKTPQPVAVTLLSETITKRMVGDRFAVNYDILQDMTNYDLAVSSGLPSIGTRLVYEKIVGRVSRVMGWNDETTINNWKAILSKSEGSFRGTVDVAVKSLTTSIKRYRKAKIWLPIEDVVLPDQKAKTLPSSLYVLPEGALEANVHGILVNVILPLVKQAPQAATDGRMNIKAVEMMKACADRRYKPAVEWMEQNGILTITNEKYCIGAKTKSYRVNIPLMMYYLFNR